MEMPREMREWQNRQIRYYEKVAAKRLLKRACLFLVFYTCIMTLAAVSLNMH